MECIFLRLPLELRQLIYLFVADNATITFTSNRPRYTNAGLLPASHQIAEEAQEILYTRLTILFEDDRSFRRLLQANHPTIAVISKNPTIRVKQAVSMPSFPSSQPSALITASVLNQPGIARTLLRHENNPLKLSMLLGATCSKRQTDLAIDVVTKMKVLGLNGIEYGWGLCLSVRNDCIALVEAMLKAGADANAKPEVYHVGLSNGEDYLPRGSAMELACHFGRHDMVKLFLRYGLASCSSSQLIDAFSRACLAGSRAIVDLLLKHGVDTNDISVAYDLLPIEAAALGGHAKIFDRLLEYGSQVMRPNSNIFDMACEGGSTYILKKLQQHGVNLQASGDKNCLEIAAEGNRLDALTWLTQQGFHVDFLGSHGPGSALKAACLHGCLEAASLLLSRGADINIDDTLSSTSYKSALHLATSEGHLSVVKMLVQEQALIDFAGPSGTALMIAINRKHEHIVRFLIEQGADVNLAVGHRESPLHSAVRTQNASFVLLLLDHGAKIGEEHRLYNFFCGDSNLTDKLEQVGFRVREPVGFPSKRRQYPNPFFICEARVYSSQVVDRGLIN